MKIEIASESDVEQLNDLIHLCYRGEESKKGWTTEAGMIEGTRTNPDDLRRQLQQPGLNFFKCTDDTGKIVACALSHHQGDKMYTGTICVHPDIQAQGLGRKMITAVEDLARKLQCKALKMEVVSARTELMAWYERLGFKHTGHSNPFPEPESFGSPKIPVVLMEMEKPIV